MLGNGKFSGIDGVANKDHACRAGGHSKIAWVTVSSGSPLFDHNYHIAYSDVSGSLVPPNVMLSIAK